MASILNATIYFEYYSLSIGELKNCHFYDHIFGDISDIFLFNISLYMGYKLHSITNNFYQFAMNGRLPEEASIKRNKIVLRMINLVCLLDMLTLVFLNIYWTFINRNM